jgi:DNA-directed RNA polymerase specialized sigma subunit
MDNFLELRKSYRVSMKTLESCLHVDENDYDDYIPEKADWNAIKRELHNEEVRSLLNNTRTGYEYLGIRLGGTVKTEWLNSLSPLEKRIFLLRYKRKKGFLSIGEMMGISPREAQKIFRSALNKVMKNID